MDTKDFSPNITGAEKGPRILFFSGGSALRDLSRIFTEYTHNSVHVITTFDSGGSSATLRAAFDMPAVGDLRCRLAALADTSNPGIKSACEFFERRLPIQERSEKLHQDLEQLCEGNHEWVQSFQGQIAEKFYARLHLFMHYMPEHFDLRGASVGNLILAAGYLENKRSLTPAVEECSNLLNIMGTVVPVSDSPAHLAVRLASGRVIVGQHLFTNKRVMNDHASLVKTEGPITDLWLSHDIESPDLLPVDANLAVAEELRQTDLICYPIGSFYSSVIANLLPRGVGRAIADASCRKVFVPNPGPDPELFGHNLQQQVEAIQKAVSKDDPSIKLSDVLNVVVVDKSAGVYGDIPKKWLESLGVAVLDFRFVNTTSSSRTFVKVDERRLSKLLVALAE